MLLMAAALAAATPVVQESPLPVTDEEVQKNVRACVAVMANQATAGQVVEYLQLDTPAKFRTFVVSCKSFMIGYQLGSQAAETPAS